MREEDVPPSINLLESMRSVGYSFSAALADLIDNSITANASIIQLDADVIEGKFVTILDNGKGMLPDQANEALRLAGADAERGKQDLGRFGLGLKTASLSQCKSLTVATRSGGTTTVLRWDIDHVKKTGRWSLLVLSTSEASSLPSWQAFDRQPNGTLVVWENLDLLLSDTEDPGSHLREELVVARDSLALVFHRFLSKGELGLKIEVNGVKLEPHDPFLESNSHTQISPVDTVRIKGGAVEVTAFTLPHSSGLTPAERARKDLSTGMREAQGFYIYRNHRLVAHGGWYGLAAKSELTKQTRIRVDIPNTLDGLWQLDIKKSRVEPPASFKAHLKRIIDPLLDRGRRVHTYRGRRAIDSHLTRVWERVEDRNGTFSYSINKDHPLLLLLRNSIPSDQEGILDTSFDLLASSFPVHDLFATMAKNGVVAEDSPDTGSVLQKLRLLQAAGALGDSAVEATYQLSVIEPFNQIANLEELIKQAMEVNPDDSH